MIWPETRSKLKGALDGKRGWDDPCKDVSLDDSGQASDILLRRD